MFKRLLIVTLCLIFLVPVLFAKARGDNRIIYNKWHGVSIDSLAESGKHYLLRQSLDTAMVLLNMAAISYRPDMTQREKSWVAKAMNNAGYACYYYFKDYTEAYSYLLKSVKVAEEVNDNTTLANSWLNIGNIYGSYNDPKAALECYGKAFDAAIANNNTEQILNIFSNMSSVAYSEKLSRDIYPQVMRFLKLKQNSTDGLAHYCRFMAKAIDADIKGDFDGAAQVLESASALPLPEHTRLAAKVMSSLALDRAGKHDAAIDSTKRLLPEIIACGQNDMLAIAYSNLSEFYGKTGATDSATRYRCMSIELSDSIFNNRQYGQLKDLKFSDSMKKANEEILLLEEQRRLHKTVSIVIGCFGAVVVILLVWLWIKHRRLQSMHEELYRKMQKEIQTVSRRKSLRDNSEENQNQELWTRICDVMRDDPSIYSPDFTLDSLASILNEKSRTVSQTINDISGAGFSALLANYRILEACRRLTDPKSHNLTIESIAQSLGFRSRSNFSAIFKKITGITPGQYQKAHLRNLSKSAGEI